MKMSLSSIEIRDFINCSKEWAQKKYPYAMIDQDGEVKTITGSFNFKDVLSRIDLETINYLSGNSILLALVASIHHGVYIHFFCKNVEKIIINKTYLDTLLQMLINGPDYKHVNARIFMAMQYVNTRNMERIAVDTQYKAYKDKFINIALGAHKYVVRAYAEEFIDEDSKKKILSVLEEFE